MTSPTEIEQLKQWVADHVSNVRPTYTLAGLLAALLGTGYSMYQGSNNDAANSRRLDEAIRHVEERVAGVEARFADSNRRLWDELPKQRKEIKDDLRYELEKGKK